MLTQTQTQIHVFLKKEAPSIADLYWSSVNILFGEDHALNSKVRLVCHLCREIGNRLPDILSEQTFEKTKQYSELVEKVAKIWNKEKPLGQYADARENVGSQENIAVSLSLLREIEQLIKKHEGAKGIREQRAQALIQYLEPENKADDHNTHVIVKQLKELIGWFAGRAHESEKNNTITEDELKSKYQIFENTLYSLIGHYYAGEDEIKRIVSEANEMTSAPDDTVVQIAIASMGKPKYRNYFFGNLKNPFWLKLLDKKGAFKDLPPVVHEGESTIYYRWPQGDYLVTVAGQRPGDVLEIIKDIETKNIRVMFPCLKALEAMPVEVAAEGMELVQKILGEKDIYNDWFYMGEPAAKLIVKFAEGGKYDEAFAIAEKLLEVKIKEDKAFGANWHNLEGRFDEYHYEELLSQYFRILWKKKNQGIRAAQALIKLLCNQIDKDQERVNKRKVHKKVKKAFKKVFGDQEEKPFEVTEHSYIIIPAVGKIDEQRHSIARAILEEICRIGEHLMKTDEAGAEAFIRLLDEKKKVIFKRIKWNTLRFAQGDKWKKEIEEILGDENNYDNYAVKEEFKALLNEKWEEVSEPIRQKFIEWAESRTIEDEEDFRKWFKEARGTDAQPEDIEAYKHYYKAVALYCVKEKEEVQEKYKKHVEESKRSEDEIRPHVLGKVETCWSGSPEYSPLKIEEMGKKQRKRLSKLF